MRFICDNMLGKLARYLRLLGFDTLYSPDHNHNRLFLAARSGRILLTTETHIRRVLAGHGLSIPFIRITTHIPNEQLQEIINKLPELKLNPSLFFTRCSLCNGILQPVAKETIKDKIPPKIYQRLNIFHQCSDCGKIYWHGTHTEKLLKLFKSLF